MCVTHTSTAASGVGGGGRGQGVSPRLSSMLSLWRSGSGLNITTLWCFRIVFSVRKHLRGKRTRPHVSSPGLNASQVPHFRSSGFHQNHIFFFFFFPPSRIFCFCARHQKKRVKLPKTLGRHLKCLSYYLSYYLKGENAGFVLSVSAKSLKKHFRTEERHKNKCKVTEADGFSLRRQLLLTAERSFFFLSRIDYFF